MMSILQKVFGETLENYETKSIGNKIYIKLDNDRRVELSFCTTGISDCYNAVKLVLVHKEKGQLHCQMVKFSDIFHCMQDLTHPNKIGKYIWYNDKEYSWYGKPTKEDLERLNGVLVSYIETWI